MSEPPSVPHQDLSPTRQRWRRFLAHRRGLWSLRLLAGLYVLSLAAELVCNDRPIAMRYNRRWFFPVVRAYTQDQVLGNGVFTRMTDYRALWQSDAFRTAPANRLVLPLFPVGPWESLRQESLDHLRRVTINLRPASRVARVQLGADGRIVWAEGAWRHFLPSVQGRPTPSGHRLDEDWALPDALRQAIAERLANLPSEAAEADLLHRAGDGVEARVRLAPFAPRRDPPTSVRLLMRHPEPVQRRREQVRREDLSAALSAWAGLGEADRRRVEEAAERSFEEHVPPVEVLWDGVPAQVILSAEVIAWPFRPVRGHWMGIDMAGRDVLARLLYGMRISMTFGLLLVGTSLLLGILAGAVQGYFAGWVDIIGQRLTEIWSALPFLYVMILVGNSLGRRFGLLLLCYAAFNWIGVSTYLRAEFLRLRGRPFVDAARSQGLGPVRIMLRHILPNGLTPLITLVPFELVGAVGALAALDYLGFGLPDGTPSWGELLRQAQLVRHAWWLILYPSLALFTVMILGVFVGEGMRDAFDPRAYSRLE